jgi:hypothetical protein
MGSTINIHGPLFDGVAAKELKTAVLAVQKEVADYALFQWQLNLEGSLQNPTGAYQSQLNVLRRGPDLVVNDGWPGSGLVYGPWLEGVGTRNKSTRFKGYFALRRAANSVAQKVTVIAQPIIDKFIVKANGV